ncbi:MAG: hypothetical protein M5U27_08840 [Gaiella sp.]|nr:hypothetical protein [Gaiella sp.]
MTTAPAAERYLRLGLRLGRHVEGIVGAYFGPPELATAVDEEPLREPRHLAADADALLAELDDGWLRDQVAGLRAYAGALASEAVSYADEVEGCYGVRPVRTDERVFAAAHDELERLLPGDGPLVGRYRRFERSLRVPAELIEPTITAVIQEAGRRTRELVELPEGEGVVVESVRDKPWLAFCQYLGRFRSRISVNVDLPMTAIELLVLAMHETYPGHHAERCCKERLLVRGRGLLEEAIVLVPTPQSLVSEGIAGLAPYVLLETAAGEALAAIVHDAGIGLDLAHAVALQRAWEPCTWAEVNAALMLHEDGKTDEEAQAYLERWGLLDPEHAAHVIRFLREPTSRTYILTYAAGLELCRAFAGSRPERLRRLLTEQVRVGELRGATGGSRGR